ncbi:Acyl transferase acyl hydrolase lysophospholipase protein [Rutstroemia sp. NJR-2017a BVV2]|nr:Acyl transferase acyl hydrolase lysophospholipase protein [Rutstroemia sp. NJR-2017a BVV2]
MPVVRAQGGEISPPHCRALLLINRGRIIAIMLGRLGMTIDECVRAYRTVAKKAFTPQHLLSLPGLPKGAYSAKVLEAAIEQVIKEHCKEADCAAQQTQGISTAETCPHGGKLFRDNACVKTVVLAVTKENVDARPTLFRTYDKSTGFQDCTISQVARATSAATTFFKSIKCGRDGIEFIDAGFGYNNPCEVLIEEAQRQFPGAHQMRVLSIGTGLGEVVTIKDKRISILRALKKMATSSKKVADRLDAKYGDGGQYYRFNVDRGLEDVTLSDWEKASQISAHTLNYLQEHDRAIKQCVNGFVNTSHTQTAAKPEPPAETKQQIPQITRAIYASGRDMITQGGSKYNSDVKGKDVTQGNELKISSSQASRDYTQEGSEFGGNIQVEGSLVQRNIVRV